MQNWPEIILGIRKSLNLSQTTLSKHVELNRQSISRFEKAQRIPNKDSINKIIKFIKKNKLNITELKELGKDCSTEAKNREKSTKLNLKHSKELAELIGIILGDGEIRKDGTIRIAFDPKKDKNFLYRKVFILIRNILHNKIGFESEGRICFGNMAFVKFLKEDCNLIPGSKFINNWEIPKWCFEKEEYIAAVLRGLFDTDGYFGYCSGSLDIMYGRFSDKCTGLVNSTKQAMIKLGLNPFVKHTKDGRYTIRLTSKIDILKFFNKIGTSNIKHAVRFLLWRFERYEAKIEIEGLKNLIKKAEDKINTKIEELNLPFLWNMENRSFLKAIQEDLQLVKNAEIRKLFKWPFILKELTRTISTNYIANRLNIGARSVRRWRDGTRIPSIEFIHTLVEIANENNINLRKGDNYG